MIENPKNIIEAAKILDIDAALALLNENPNAWQETIDGETLASILITHLRQTPKPKNLRNFIKKLLAYIPENEIDAFITCEALNTTLLHEAVMCDNIELINLLIEHGVNRFIVRPGDGLTAFALAVANNANQALMALSQDFPTSPFDDDHMLAILTEAKQMNRLVRFWSIILGYCNVLDLGVAEGLAAGRVSELRMIIANLPNRPQIYHIVFKAACAFNFDDLARRLIDIAIKDMGADGLGKTLTIAIDHDRVDLATWLLDNGVMPEIAKRNTGLLYSPTLEAAARTGNKALRERLIGYPQITPGIVLNTVVGCAPMLCGSEEGRVAFLDLLDHGEPDQFELIAITQIVVECDCHELLTQLIERGLNLNLDYRFHHPVKECRRSLLGCALLPYDNEKIEGRFDCALILIANGYLSCRNSSLLLAGLLRGMAVVEHQVDKPLIKFLAGFGASPILLIEDYINLCDDEEATEEELTVYRTAVMYACECSVIYLENALILDPKILLHEVLTMINRWSDLTVILQKCLKISGSFSEFQRVLQALLDALDAVRKAAQDISIVPSLFEQAYIAILNAGEDDPNLLNELNKITQQVGISPEICQRIVDIQNGYVFTLPSLIARRLMGG